MYTIAYTIAYKDLPKKPECIYVLPPVELRWDVARTHGEDAYKRLAYSTVIDVRASLTGNKDIYSGVSLDKLLLFNESSSNVYDSVSARKVPIFCILDALCDLKVHIDLFASCEGILDVCDAFTERALEVCREAAAWFDTVERAPTLYYSSVSGRSKQTPRGIEKLARYYALEN